MFYFSCSIIIRKIGINNAIAIDVNPNAVSKLKPRNRPASATVKTKAPQIKEIKEWFSSLRENLVITVHLFL